MHKQLGSDGRLQRGFVTSGQRRPAQWSQEAPRGRARKKARKSARQTAVGPPAKWFRTRPFGVREEKQRRVFSRDDGWLQLEAPYSVRRKMTSEHPDV